jgi:cysteine-rich repeat protein
MKQLSLLVLLMSSCSFLFPLFTPEGCEQEGEAIGCEEQALLVCHDGFAVLEPCQTGVCIDGVAPQCASNICGDNQLEAPEQCDDGNLINGDGCDASCLFEVLVTCGDGILDSGEECDDGNQIDTDECRNVCRIPVCGDLLISLSEQCDDGNITAGDGCDNVCRVEFCGDGITNNLNESCDDGNQIDIDECLNNCNNPSCGDGIVRDGVEECDDANQIETDVCTNQCVLFVPGCGNSIIEAGEACDDGNQVDGDGCEAGCLLICQATSGAQGATLDSVNNHCYLGFDEVIDWQLAESNCEGLGGYLAVIESLEENILARTATDTTNNAWIGFNDLAVEEDLTDGLSGDDFVKVTGGFIDGGFSNFAFAEPNNAGDEDCLHFVNSGDNNPLLWNDAACSVAAGLPFGVAVGYVCEVEPLPCGDNVLNGLEQCDDGNRVDGDGCSSVCLIE